MALCVQVRDLDAEHVQKITALEAQHNKRYKSIEAAYGNQDNYCPSSGYATHKLKPEIAAQVAAWQTERTALGRTMRERYETYDDVKFALVLKVIRAVDDVVPCNFRSAIDCVIGAVQDQVPDSWGMPTCLDHLEPNAD